MWVKRRDINGNYYWVNTDTGEHKDTLFQLGTILNNAASQNKIISKEKSLIKSSNPTLKKLVKRSVLLHQALSTVNTKNAYTNKVHNYADETIKLPQDLWSVLNDKYGNPLVVKNTFVPQNEAPLEITGPEKWYVETEAIPFKPLKEGLSELAGLFGKGALKNLGNKTISKLGSNSEKAKIKLLSKNKDSGISLNDDIQQKLTDLSNYVNSLNDTGIFKELSMDKSTDLGILTAGKYIVTHSIKPPKLQQFMSDIQLKRLEKLGIKNDDDVFIPSVGGVTTPKEYITNNAGKPSYLGISNRSSVVGSYYPTNDLAITTPEQSSSDMLSTLMHERVSHGTDNLIERLGFDKKYQQLLDLIKKGKSFEHRPVEDSNKWYELRATMTEFNSKLYNDARKLVRDKGIQDTDSNYLNMVDKKYNELLDNISDNDLIWKLSKINSYGSNYRDDLNWLINNSPGRPGDKIMKTFRLALKTLPAITPAVLVQKPKKLDYLK